MIFNFIHPTILVFVNGFIILLSSQIAVDEKNVKKRTVEQIVIGIFVSLAWLGVGIYTKVNGTILIFEAVAVAAVLIALVMKLNIPGGHTFFGWAVPGHGAPEGQATLAIKKILFYIVATITILVILGAIVMALDVL